MGNIAYAHFDRALTAAEIYAAEPRWPRRRREIARDRLEWMRARLSGAQARGDYDEADRWRTEVASATDVYAVFDREARPLPPRQGPQRPWLAVDNTAAHDRLERERSDAHAAQTLARGLSDAQRRELGTRERAAIDGLRRLQIVREVRIRDWTVTIWFLAPGEPRGYGVTVVHDYAEEIAEPRAWFTFEGAAAFAGEQCHILET